MSDAMDTSLGDGMGDMQIQPDLPPYEPQPLAGSRRAGIRYKAYSAEDFERAMRAVKEEGMSLRKASMTYNVPKTTLAEKLGDACPNLPPLQATRKNRIATRYTWTEADMEKAVAAVSAGTHASEAARKFGVPYSHLNSRARGRPPRELKADLARLTLKQENLMVDWASALCQLGFPPTKDQIYDLASAALRKNGVDQKLGRQWVGHWLRRHPDITALDWVPKPKWDKKPGKPPLPPGTTDNDFDPASIVTPLAPGPSATEDSFIQDASHLEDSTIDPNLEDADGNVVDGGEQGIAEVATLILQT
jgi:hypothetical protein